MIEKRINNRCSNEDTFNKHKGFYKEALKESGYNYKLKYKTDPTTKTKRKKARYPDQFWFNPPWNKKLKTNIAREFLRLLDKNLPKGTKWAKFFNRHTTRVSYSCTRNIAAHIKAHNQRVTQSSQEKNPGCNCRNNDCPLEDQNCLTQGLSIQPQWKQRRTTTLM